MFAAVCGIADQRPRPQVHDEVELLQGELTNQDRNVVGNFHHVHHAESPLDCQPHRVVQGGFGNADTASDLFLILFLEAELPNEPRWQ